MPDSGWDHREQRPAGSGCRVITAAGVRLLEERMLADLRQRIEKAGAGLLKRPLLVVVASGTLRRHLLARIAGELGPTCLGVAVHTLWGLGGLVLGRAGVRPLTGKALVPVVIRRRLAAEPDLAEDLAALEDGFELARGSVGDLLSAALEPELVDGLRESVPGNAPGARRARALLRAAGAALGDLRAAGLGPMSETLRLATETLRDQPAAVHASAVFIHGFADATGRALDLLETLARALPCNIYVDRPASPLGADGREERFPAPFLERFSGIGARLDEPTTPADPVLELVAATDLRSEVRAVAARIRRLLDDGALPESICVVTRSAASHAVTLRRGFEELGIPFSGPRSPATQSPIRHRARAACTLLDRGPDTPCETWLDACAPAGPAVPTGADLRQALRRLNLGSLGALVAADPEQLVAGDRGLDLHVPRALDRVSQDGRGLRCSRRRLTRRQLAACAERAQRALQFERDGTATLDTWRARATRFLEQALDWGSGADRSWRAALDDLDAPATLTLDCDEFLAVLRGAFDGLGEEALGGAGSGVQVLDAARARGLTAEHLFLLGLQRGAFPRTPTEDPFLPSALRRPLRDLLPDLHGKARGQEEESWLFAHLLSMAPRVTLSWQRLDEKGRPVAVSPFVDALLTRPGAPEPRELPQDVVAALQQSGRPLTLREHLYLAARAGGGKAFQTLLAESLCEGLEHHGGELLQDAAAGAAELARARQAALDLHRRADDAQTTLATHPLLGVLPPPLAADPRNRDLYVTRLENLARCPWQAHLRILLEIERAPDPLDGFSISPLLLGNMVHAALEHLVKQHLPEAPTDLGEALKTAGVEIPRPDAAAILAALRAEAPGCARQADLHASGLHEVLIERARPHVEAACEQLFDHDPEGSRFLGAELRGQVELPVATGGRRALHFKADLVQVTPEGLLLTDYKTGTPPSKAKMPATRRKHFVTALTSGIRLQAAAYGAATGTGRGRYLYLHPDLDAELRDQGTETGDEQTRAALLESAGWLLAAWMEGVAFPRLEDGRGNESAACKHCDVRDACIIGDSGLRHFVLGQQDALKAAQRDDRERILARLWWNAPDVLATGSSGEAEK